MHFLKYNFVFKCQITNQHTVNFLGDSKPNTSCTCVKNKSMRLKQFYIFLVKGFRIKKGQLRVRGTEYL